MGTGRDDPASGAGVPDLEQRLRAVENTLRVFCVALVVVLGGISIRMAIAVPKFRQIFKDMLGSEDAFPGLTKAVVNASAAYPLLFLCVPFGLMVVGCVAAVRVPLQKWLVVYGVSILLMGCYWALLALSLYLPMTKIIQGVANMN